MKKTLFFILLVALSGSLILSSACKKNSDFQGTLIDVPKDFNAKMWQVLTDDGGDFAIVLSTIKTQNCNNTAINAFPNIYGSHVILTIKDLTASSNCLGNGDVARDTIDGSHLTNGIYDFQLNLKDAVFNKGILTVSDNKFTLAMDTQNGIIVDATDLTRVPNNIIWGLVNYDNGSDAQADQFLSDLKSDAHNITLDNGEYGHFQINNNIINLSAETQTSRPNTKKFFFKLDNSIKNLSDLVQKYRKQYGSKMNLVLNTWNGKSL